MLRERAEDNFDTKNRKILREQSSGLIRTRCVKVGCGYAIEPKDNKGIYRCGAVGCSQKDVIIALTVYGCNKAVLPQGRVTLYPNGSTKPITLP